MPVFCLVAYFAHTVYLIGKEAVLNSFGDLVIIPAESFIFHTRQEASPWR